MSDAYPQLTVSSREQLRSWLAAHHATAPGIWLVTYKKNSGGPHVPYGQIVEEALAHGWVDSRPRKLAEDRSQLLLTPRKPTSNWSRVNKQRVQRLIAADQMAPAGLAAVAVAKKNGTWNALDAVEALEEPAELAAALDLDADARRHWDAFPRSTKRGILEWISNAKRQQTREKRIAETARLASENIRANQWRQPKGAAGFRTRS